MDPLLYNLIRNLHRELRIQAQNLDEGAFVPAIECNNKAIAICETIIQKYERENEDEEIDTDGAL